MSTPPRPVINVNRIKRPTVTTPFHIDYDWWKRNDRDLKTFLFTRFQLDEGFLDVDEEFVDIIDPVTGEVTQVDGFQYAIQSYLNQVSDDYLQHMPFVDAVFCVLLANANKPLTAQEIGERLHRPAETVLSTLGGPQVYRGIRPNFDDD